MQSHQRTLCGRIVKILGYMAYNGYHPALQLFLLLPTVLRTCHTQRNGVKIDSFSPRTKADTGTKDT